LARKRTAYDGSPKLLLCEGEALLTSVCFLLRRCRHNTQLFAKASELARKLGVPRIYISANSGARIGIAEEVMSTFRVAWQNPENPAKGALWPQEQPCVH